MDGEPARTAKKTLFICGACVVAIALIVTATVWAGDLAAEQSADSPPGAEALSDPLIRDQVESQEEAIAAAEAERSTPEEISARESARTAYAGLSPEAAEELALQTFPALREPTWEPFEPDQGAEILRYLGTSSALVAPIGADVVTAPPTSPDDPLPGSGDPAALVESLLPLRAPESGSLRPLDSELVDRGDFVEPSNATVEAELPDTLSDAIALPELDIEVKPEHAEQAEPATIIGPDKAFYADVDTDTDFIASPTQTGVETFYQLRSTASPELLSLDLSLPAGATLEPAFDGTGAIVVVDDEVHATVAPPLAFDADGTYVPVALEVVDDQITIEVRHRSGDWKLPILVDPVIEPYNFNWSGGCADQTYWRWQSYWTNKFFKGCGPVTGGPGYAIASQANGGFTYGHNEYAQWYYSAPSGTWIEKAEFTATDHAHGPGASMCSVRGLYDPSTGQWQTGFGADHEGFFYGISTRCSPWAQQNWSQNIGWSDSLTDPNFPDDPRGRNPNMAVLQLFANGTGWRSQDSWNLIRGANFTIYDENNPSITSAPRASDSIWRDDSAQGGANYSYLHRVTASDPGVGVGQYWLWITNPNGQNNVNGIRYEIKVFGRGCTNIRGCRSAWTKDLDYKLPEGRTDVSVTAFDQLMHGSTGSHGWTQRIDRRGPNMEVSSGSLYDQRSRLWTTHDYQVTLEATDGSTATPSQMRSGVVKLELMVDGQPVSVYDEELDEDVPIAATQDCAPAVGSCRMTRTFDVPGSLFTPGTHAVATRATDALGHRSSGATFQVTAVEDLTAPTGTLTASQADAAGNYTLRLQADDGGPIGASGWGSGVVHAELWVDDVYFDDIDQPCDSGGCPLDHTFKLTRDQSLADHQISVFVDDKAGNGEAFVHGKQSRPPYVGYNDEWVAKVHGRSPNFFRRSLDLVTAHRGSNGSMMRVYVDWCQLTNEIGEAAASNPDNWKWQKFDPMFNEIAEYRRGVPDDPAKPPHPELRVLIEVFGSPNWVRDTADQNNRCDAGLMPASTARMGDWATFVREVVERYGGQQYGTIGIEVWNEPNVPKFWRGGPPNQFVPDPQRFARLYNAAYPAIKSYDTNPDSPGTQALMALPGGLSPVGRKSPDGVDANDADAKTYMLNATDPNRDPHIVATQVDALSVHLYANKATGRRDARDRIANKWEQFRAGLRNHATDASLRFRTKDYWITEIGFPSRSGPLGSGKSTETQQAVRLMNAYTAYALKPIVKTFMVHRLFDQTDAQEPTDLTKSENRLLGVIDYDLRPEDPNADNAVLEPRDAYCRLGARLGGASC